MKPQKSAKPNKYIIDNGVRIKRGEIMRLLGFVIIFFQCNYSSGPAYVHRVKFKKFRKPCFVGDEIENTCSNPSELCHDKQGMELKLVRLDGIKVIIYYFISTNDLR